MASPNSGITIKDILPIPDNVAAIQDEDHPDNELAQTLRDEATTSHALAMADHEDKGLAQQDHDGEVKDLGWNESNRRIANPLVGGLHNDDLWVLLRRFNLQMYHVKELKGAVPGNLDLNIADEEEFSPDKLRANIERLYMTVGIGILTFGKHIARLRSWRERQRTAVFCAAYFLAWVLDLLAPLMSLTVIVLIVYPPSRTYMFPPAPLAIVDGKTGGVKKPKAGVLGSTDSATGAPENHKGEAVEAEASGFVSSLASVALASASGKHPMDQAEIDEAGEEGSASKNVPDPTAVASGLSNARADAVPSGVPAKKDKAKVPMETAIWNQMRPIMHGLADVSDTWERFGNALSPTPPFPQEVYRLRLAALVVPLLGASIFITNYMLVKGITFGVGFGFFGDPIITPSLHWLNSTFPHWQRILELRNTVLKGVPTNAQLTVTLLRIGEANKAPLPPAPRTGAAPPDEPVQLSNGALQATGDDTPLDATDEELAAAMGHNPETKHSTTGSDVDASKKTSHGKKGSHVLSAMKTSIKGTVEAALGADHLKAKVGSEPSKRRLGVVPSDPNKYLTGPVDFKCRCNGKKGHAYISVRATIPCVAFSLDKSIESKGSLGREDEDLNPQWSVAVAEIAELKKLGGLGWKAKLVVGWALNREVADGLEIVDRLGNHYVLTAMVLRNELFNRLIAMGGQKWEAW